MNYKKYYALIFISWLLFACSGGGGGSSVSLSPAANTITNDSAVANVVAIVTSQQ